MTPLRVLVTEPDLEENGAIRSMLGLIGHWRADGVAVRVAVAEPLPAHRGPAVPVPEDLDVVLLAPGAERLRRRLPQATLELVRMARSADVVVAGRELGWGLLLGRVAARIARRPFAVFVRSDPDRAIAEHIPERLRPPTYRALGAADLAVCISQGLLHALRALPHPPRRTVAVTHGFDTARVLRLAAEPGPDPSPEPVVVGVGRLVPQKGFDLLVRAHARVRAEGLAHRVVVLGEGEERERLTALARELGVADTVALPGFADNPHPVVAAASVLCVPSRWEGFSVVLAEALTLGTPVIAADCPHGPREVVDGGRFGALVGVDDVEGLSRALAAHLAAPDDLRRRAAAGRAEAVERFDLRREAADALAALRTLTGAGGQPERIARRRPGIRRTRGS